MMVRLTNFSGFIMAGCFIATITHASPAIPDDALRDTVLAGLAKNTQQHFHFVQEKKLAILDKPLITEGELLLNNNHNNSHEKQQTITWDIQKPYELRYVLTPDSIREIDAQGERTVQISQNPVAAALTQAMTATFSGHWQDGAHQNDKNSLAIITAQGTLASWQLQITPEAEELKPLIHMIAVDGANKIINTIVIAETNGDSTTIHLQPFIKK
jgi:hypothetical protein